MFATFALTGTLKLPTKVAVPAGTDVHIRLATGTVADPDGSVVYTHEDSTTTDALGAFTFPTLPTGPGVFYRVWSADPGVLDAFIFAAPAVNTDLSQLVPVTAAPLAVSKGEKGDKGDTGVTFGAARAVLPGDSIQAAITLAIADGGGTVRLLRGTHSLTTPIALASNITLEGEPGTVVDQTAIPSTVPATPAITATGTWSAPTLLTADAVEGAITVTVADATGIVAGDRVKVSSSSVFGSTSQKRGEIVHVASVATNVLTIEDPLCDSYALIDAAQAERMAPVENVTIRGFSLRGGGNSTLNVVGIHLTACVNVRLDELVTQNLHTAAVYLTDVVGASITGCRFTDGKRAGYGYGVAILYASQDVSITNLTGDKLRHAVTIGGGLEGRGITRRVTVAASVASTCDDAGFDCHPGGEYVSFIGCHVLGSAQDGIVMQGARFTISGCTISGASRYGILIQNLTIRGLEGTVTGNVVTRAGTRGIACVFNTTDPTFRVWSGLAVVGNLVTDSGYGITLENSSAAFDAEGVSIVGNIVRRVTTSHAIFLRGLLGASVQGNSIFDPAATSEGLYLNDCADAVVSGNQIDGGATTGRAIRLVASPNVSITGNRLKGAAVGVLTDVASAPTLYMGNINTCTSKTTLAGTGNLSTTADALGAYNL